MSLAIVALFLAAAAMAGAEKQWVGQEEFSPDPANPAVSRFTVDIHEPGSYQILLTVRGEARRQIELALSLQPEAGGADRTVHFSFTGAGCG
jgi:hypothetical protein